MKRALIKRNVPITKIFGCYKKNDIPKGNGQQKKNKIDYFIPWNEICVVNLLILIRYDPKEKTSSGVCEKIRQCFERNSIFCCSGETTIVFFLLSKYSIFFLFDLLF